MVDSMGFVRSVLDKSRGAKIIDASQIFVFKDEEMHPRDITSGLQKYRKRDSRDEGEMF